MSLAGMRAIAKWLGAALVTVGVIAFPAAIWYPGPWGVVSLLLVMFGCVFLVAALRGAPVESEKEAGQDDAKSAGGD